MVAWLIRAECIITSTHVSRVASTYLAIGLEATSLEPWGVNRLVADQNVQGNGGKQGQVDYSTGFSKIRLLRSISCSSFVIWLSASQVPDTLVVSSL